MIKCSLSILCLVRSSTSTGLKAPRPIFKLTLANFTPFISRRIISAFVKCRPAAGGAIAPSISANIV